MEISDLKIYKEEEQIISSSAIIDGVQHYTADIRGTIVQGSVQAVFSKITADPIMFESTLKCVEFDIYTQHDIAYIEVYINHYIYIDLDISKP